MLNCTLDNRYTVLEYIGGGGMADVYRAHDTLLDRSVAVKILSSKFTNDDEFVARFGREAKAAAKLSHPNIVNVYDVGRDHDVYYIVMEYISGETLKEKIVREAPLPIDSTIQIAVQIAEALDHAHQNDLVHCDVKPHNILITRAGRVKVTDFGIARAVASTSMTQTSNILGSVHYFSPEQAKGAAVDAKSDIYSLGVVMFEMLTGQVPFQADTPMAIALQHLQDNPPLPRKINPDIPPLLEAIVLKAMSKNPEERFVNINAMIDDLNLMRNYLRDEQTRHLSAEDYPTQVLPQMNVLDDKGSQQKKLGSRKNGALLVTAFAILLLIGFAMGAFLTFGKFWSPQDVNVPNVVGKRIAEAEQILLGQRLKMSVAEAFDPNVAAGVIISQDPGAGSVVKEERVVKLVVSRGGELIAVPDLRGINRREAEIQIKNAGFNIGPVEEIYSASIAQDIVISQSHNPSTKVAKGTEISLLVSKGVEARKLKLPDFKGLTLDNTKLQLEKLKLKVGSIIEEPSNTYPKGTISGQNPAPDTEIIEGTSVDLMVSNQEQVAVKRAIVQIVVPEGPAKQVIQIVITDANSRRVVYQGTHNVGERVEKTVEGVGNVRVQVYINGSLAQEQAL